MTVLSMDGPDVHTAFKSNKRARKTGEDDENKKHGTCRGTKGAIIPASNHNKDSQPALLD